MAKMTKKEKLALAEMQKQAEWNEFRASYAQRFAALMYEFGKLPGFTVQRRNDNEYVFDNEQGVWGVLYPSTPEAYDFHYMWEVETLENAVKAY